MHLKIYFGDKPVYLCDTIDNNLQEILHHPDAVFIDELSNAAIQSLLHEIIKPEFHAGVLWHADLEKLRKLFFRHFTTIEAAGGIVQNEKKEILFIFRLGKWDLPKGKVEKGEDIAHTAIREVEEETGIKKLTLQKKIGETYHTYNAYGKHFLKTTHWYHITCPSGQTGKPQTEEDITAIKWVNPSSLEIQMKNTYPSIIDIAGVFLEKK